MNRSLVCVHCGCTVGLEPQSDPIAAVLSAHLILVHPEVVDRVAEPRWAKLLEHFRIGPLDGPSIPRGLEI